MTTTGGRGDIDLTAPVIERADGDDIVVEPQAPPTRPRRRNRSILAGVIVLALLAAGIGIALAARDDTPTAVRAAAPVRRPAARPHRIGRPVTTRPRSKVSIAPTPTVAPTVPAAVAPAPTVAPPAAIAAPPTAPPSTAPAAQPPSVLQWHATPAALVIKAGKHAALGIAVVNPTDGVVTLGQPLSCAPVLQRANGTAIGGAMCEAMAQLLSPHQELHQQYTIYATDTADATGKALAPGRYTVRVENLFSVPVTITAS